MSRSIRRGAVAATIALALAPLAAACSSGTDAETTKIKPDTASVQVGNVKVQNLTLVSGGPTSGAMALGGAFINDGDQAETLTQVAVDGATGNAELKSASGTGAITIPAHGAVYLTGGADSVVAKVASVSGDSPVTPGKYAKVTLTFKTAGSGSVRVQVHSPEDYFKQLAPSAPAPSLPAAPPTTAPASPSAPASATASAPASAPATGAPTGGASNAPTGAATATSTATRPANTVSPNAS
ncbi:DUF461 domain-containing protein [Uniformispora flossi]|uniref:DUF461 domain-containing protein n=1 Tax=Uniformispora flossi TaxID=3390723 RepID=UPI003C2B9F5C